MSALKVGDLAPDFTLPDQRGTPVRLCGLLGKKNVVLYFYPKDASPGCTAEARAFREAYASFRSADTEVVGVSSDSVKSHERFAAKHQLPFLLLSDRDGTVRAMYGVEKTLGILPGRVTFVIARDGIVRRVYSSQLAATRHVRVARQAMQGLPR